MKFSVAALFSGTALIAAPLLAHAYQLHTFELLVTAVLTTQGSVNLPESPTVWYAVSSCAGMALVALGYRMESFGVRPANP
jgi:hypothetical protein